MSDDAKPLAGHVALVAGATRGAGRGIAAMLGAAGAVVYCSGRSTRDHPATPGQPETIEETAEQVTALGGIGVAVRADHTQEDEVAALIARIRADHGRLDILVNDVWGGDDLIDWNAKFWTLDMGAAATLIERAVFSHMLTARLAVPMMVEAGRGLIVEVTDGETPGYRGQLLYDLIKASVIRLAYAMAWDLSGTGLTALAITPGFLRSEQMLRNFGVDKANWRDAIAQDPFFEQSETPFFIGRAIAALAADPNVRAKSGRALGLGELADEYGFTDVDGRVPRFWPTVEAWLEARMAAGDPPDRTERFMGQSRYGQIHASPAHRDLAGRLAVRFGLTGLPPALGPAPG